MAFVKLSLPPGMLRVGTIYHAIGRWYQGNLVRWVMDGGVFAAQPIGGWVQRTATAVTGMARAMITWTDNDTLRWIAIGTHSKLYVMSQTTDAPVDITPAGFTAGDADATAGAGYGIGPYGVDEYGAPRVDNATYQEASMWSLDTFGELLYGMMVGDGNLYKWELDTGTAAALASVNAPTGDAIVVTEERFIFVLGADGDARTVAWPDQESDSTWTPSATNQAGSYVIETQGKLMCGERIRGGTLIFTDMDVHLATYVAQPYIYSFNRVGENCGIASRGASVSTGTRCYWMGRDRFYMFDGATHEIQCDVLDGVFEDFNDTQRSKVTSHHEPKYSEVWWLYPSAASTEIDRAVVYNYAGGFWMIHDDFARTVAAARGVFNNPLMVDASGDVWDHETGQDFDGDAPYLESGPYEIGDGERSMRVRAFVADEKTTADVTVSFKVRDWPGDSETTYGPYTPSGRTPARFSGRQARIRIDGAVETSWRWGTPRVEVLPGAKRWAA